MKKLFTSCAFALATVALTSFSTAPAAAAPTLEKSGPMAITCVLSFGAAKGCTEAKVDKKKAGKKSSGKKSAKKSSSKSSSKKKG